MNTENDFDAVYQNVLPELLAVPEDQLTHLDAEVDEAVTTVAMAIAHTRALVDSVSGVEDTLMRDGHMGEHVGGWQGAEIRER